MQCKQVPQPVKNYVQGQLNDTPKRIKIVNSDTSDNEIPNQESTFIEQINEDEKHALDIKLTEAVVTGSLSHSFLENSAFKTFLASLNPFYKPPNRKIMSEKLVPELYQETEMVVNSEVRRANFVALSCDGWKDRRKRAIVNVIVHCPLPLLYRSIDTGLNAHTDIIEEIGARKVIAIVSDHASNMKNAWSLLLAEYQWLITSGCKSHPLMSCWYYVKKLLFFFRRTPRGLLEDAQMILYGQKYPLEMPSDIRWGTNHKLLAAVIQSRGAINQVLNDRRIQEKARLKPKATELFQKLSAPINAQKLIEIECVLRPLTNVLKMIEGDEVNSAEAYIMVMNVLVLALSDAENMTSFDQNIREEVKEIIHQRMEFGSAPVFYLSKLLDPRDKGRSLDESMIEAGIKTLVEKILKHPLFACDEAKCIPITSASNERNWSVRGNIQTPLRNRMSTEIASMETYVKYNLKKIRRVQEGTSHPIETFYVEQNDAPANDENDYEFFVIEDDEEFSDEE
uniref:DUF659 domain-containing protein n=1 Tax=Acrobeloides nanus TaxID=290746 RepID=A0A914CF95_9BILA